MTTNLTALRLIGLTLLSFALSRPCPADVRLPAIFGSHMVLQQDAKIPVWGWAEAGEAVTVTVGDHKANTTTDATGKWRVDLEPMPAGTAPLSMTVAGKNTLTLTDVLVGDVWVCSGQSNMEFGMNRGETGPADILKADDPQIRLFVVEKVISLDPKDDTKGMWALCTPKTVAWFSAVGYYFGRELRQKYNRPVGLIADNWGGTPAQAWTSLTALQKDPPFTNYITPYQKIVADFPAANEAYTKLQADYLEQAKQYQSHLDPTYVAAMKVWNEASRQAAAAGQVAPPRPVAPQPMPKAPLLPQGGPSTASVLFNGMIAPIIPYTIKGVIWYQGEANTGAGIEYRTLFPRMINDWRERWNEGNFPFLFVQLANLTAAQKMPSEGGWALLREAQLMTLSLPNTGMAVVIDIGNPLDIHPKDKADVAHRLFLAARHVAYGEDLVYSGPIYDTMKIDGNKIRVSFKNTGTGLQMGVPPWSPTGVIPPAPTELKGFAIAGADQVWSWAKAEIEGGEVVVSSDQVAAPVAVRYGWATNPPCNLYNVEGLPASPFRTDDWTDPAPPPRPPTPSAPPAPVPSPTPAPTP
jgi:sialate O-acetylesterase